MSFKKLEVYGFKSFADKTTIEFESGVTGIVGPNGCGKSNVVDAVRWVLGEQSAKLLRGDKMQDVIFNGTDVRKSLSFCEVSLHFDNTNRIFALDTDNIIITRKLYRSNESDYMLNRQPCRLKDITDLLRDTGVGKEGYCIIGQGKIDALLSAKPEDRRGIFEEAAGISKFKKSKRDTENNLAKVQENLVRFNDIISEMEKRRGPLEEQAEDAKKALELRDQLRLNEVNVYIYQYENASESKRLVQEVLDGVNQEIAMLQDDFNTAQYEYNKRTEAIAQADEQLNALRDERTALLVEAEKLSGKNTLLQDRIENIKADRNRLTAEIDKAEASLKFKSETLEETLRATDTLDKELVTVKAQLKELEVQYEAICQEINVYEEQINTSTSKVIDSYDELMDIKANMSKLLAEQDALTQRYSENEEKRQQIMIDSSAITEDLQRCREDLKTFAEKVADLTRRKDSVYKRREELQTLVNEYIGKVHKLEDSITAYDTKYRMLEDMRKDYVGYQNAVKYLMKDAIGDAQLSSRIEGTMAELINVPKEYQVAIEMVLGQVLQNVVTRDEKDTKYLIDYLKSKGYGRVTFLPLNCMYPRRLDNASKGVLDEKGVIGLAIDIVKYDAKYDILMSSQLGSTVVVEDLDVANYIARKYSHAFRIVTLDGDVIATTGSITGGSRRTETSNILGQEEQIKNMKSARDNAQKDLAKMAGLLKETKRQLNEAVVALDNISKQLHDAEIEYALEKEKENKYLVDLARYEAEDNALKTQNDGILEKITIIETQVKSVDRLEGNITEQRSEVNRLVELHKAEFDKRKVEREETSKLLTETQVKCKTIEGEILAKKDTAIRLKRECEDLQTEIYDMRALLATAIARQNETEQEAMSISMSEDDRSKIIDIERRIAEGDDMKKKLLEEQSAFDEKKNVAMQQLQVATARQAQEQARLERIDTDIDLMGQHIAEEYQLDYQSALTYRVDGFDCEEGMRVITKVKRQIHNLGPINMRAIEDFKELNERYNEHIEQRDDMLKAEADLKKIISDLTVQMTDKFATEFKKIQENFSVVFRELFGGGEGQLILEENPDDPLGAGIEILATPKGKKKMQSISLLSGGERAFTAIAILFAIIKLKPMPFCILDEIEAALDDSNAKLFASYLRKFSKETQFIIITHRKPTMELADALYGVTMQEPGVSKMVSVKLADAIKTAKKD